MLVLCPCTLMFLKQNSNSFCSDCHSKAGSLSKNNMKKEVEHLHKIHSIQISVKTSFIQVSTVYA